MNNPERKLPEPTLARSTAWTWLWPAVVAALMLAKLLGLVAGFVALGTYAWLKPKSGIWRAVAASAALAVLAGVGTVVRINHGA